MNVDITRRGDHYELYINGEFVCSADTAMEAAREADEYMEKIRGGVNA